MEQPPNIDQLFRERLQQADVPPPAFVWPQVEAELRRRRRRFFLWLWLGVGLAGIGLWSLWQMNPSDVHSFAATPPLEQQVGSNGVITEQKSQANTLAETSSNSLNSSSAKLKEEIKSESRAQQNNISRSSRTLKFKDQSPSLKTRSDNNVTSTTTTTLPTLSSPKGGSVTDIARVLPLAYSATSLSILPGLESGLTLPAPSLILPKAKPFVFKKKKPRKNCYDFAQHPQVWLLDAYVGPSLPQRQLTATQNEFDDYLQQRRNTESSSWSFNGGLRGSLMFGQHFLLRTGAHYEQRTEVFKYVDPDFFKKTVTITTEIVDGMPQTTIDSSTEYVIHLVKTYNRFGMLDIPLLAGAEFRAGRAGISLQAGASINVFFWKRGTILNPQGDPQKFTPDQRNTAPVFRQHLGLSATASAQLFYHVRSRVRLFAEPYYSHSFRPITLANQPITQRYTTWGLKLGVTKIFD